MQLRTCPTVPHLSSSDGSSSSSACEHTSRYTTTSGTQASAAVGLRARCPRLALTPQPPAGRQAAGCLVPDSCAPLDLMPLWRVERDFFGYSPRPTSSRSWRAAAVK
jgi:hypothetical protein